MMKNALFNCGAGMLLALNLTLGGCHKPAPTVTVQATPSPTPSPTPDTLFDGRDLDTGKIRAKASKAAESVGKYLDTQDPKLRERFEKLKDKLSAQLEKDKGRWREKLEAKRHELEPQIEQLRAQLASTGDAAKGKLREQLAELEKQSGSTEEKLARLQTVGADAWKQFKAQLKADQAKEKAPENSGQSRQAATPKPGT